MVETRSSAATAAEGPSSQQQQQRQADPVDDPAHDHDGMPNPPENRESAAAWQFYHDQIVRYVEHINSEHRAEMAGVRAQRDQALQQVERAAEATTQAATQAAIRAATEAAAAATAAAAANPPSRARIDKTVIKTQGKAPEVYDGGSYAKYDSYITEIEHQFTMNNVLERADMDAQKISYAVTFLGPTPKQEWLAESRDSNEASTWDAYKSFLEIRAQDSATFAKDTLAKWEAAEQRGSQKAADYIAYLDRQRSYLPADLRPNEAMQMHRLSVSLVADLKADLATQVPAPTTYKDLRDRVLILEENLRSKKRILATPGHTGGTGFKRGRRSNNPNDDDQSHHIQQTRGNYRGRGMRQSGYRYRRGGRTNYNHTPATGPNVEESRQARRQRRDGHIEDGGCFECGNTGHWAKDCPEKSKNT